MNPGRWIVCAILAFAVAVACATASPRATTIEYGFAHTIAATAIEYGL
ncbi:hypothetical protein ACFRCG_37390 [Embleya sp. NPDC056575]